MKNNEEQKSGYGLSVMIIGTLFFIFGFVTWTNSILIPYLKIACELEYDYQSYFVATAFYISYFVMAIPASWVLKKTGFKRGMQIGLSVMAIGALIFIPAALTRQYSLFLLGLFVMGTGLSILQTASNPYITILGPIESAARRISIMGVANKLAGAIGPIILGAIILDNSDELKLQLVNMDAIAKNIALNNLASKVIMPYIIIAVVLILLSIMIKYSKLPDIDINDEENTNDKLIDNKSSIFKHPNLIFGVIAIFLYVGAEVIVGDTIVNYGINIGYPMKDAKFLTSITMMAMMAGYLLGIILIPKRLKQEKALVISSILAIIISILVVVTNGNYSIINLAMLGFANSLMWPTIWPLAINGLGKLTKLGSSLLIMAIAGGAILPPIYGKLSLYLGSPKLGYLILIPCYLFILFYSTKGYKIGKKS